MSNLGSGTFVIVKVKEALILFELSLNTIVKCFVPSAPDVSKLTIALLELPMVPTLLPLTNIPASTSPLISTSTSSSEVVVGGCMVNTGFDGATILGSSFGITIGIAMSSIKIRAICSSEEAEAADIVFIIRREEIMINNILFLSLVCIVIP